MGQAERKAGARLTRTKSAALQELERQCRQRWGTPNTVPHNLRRLFGWDVTLDVAAEAWSTLTPKRWYGPGSPFREDAMMGRGLELRDLIERSRAKGIRRAEADALMDQARAIAREIARVWVADLPPSSIAPTLAALYNNPPFAWIDAWVLVALEAVALEAREVLWIPSRTDRPWWRWLVKSPHARVVWVEGRVEHRRPPELADMYAAEGVPPAGNGGPVALWFLHPDPEQLPARDLVLHRDDLERQPGLFD